MPLYMYQCSYTAESIAAQIEEPQDRIERAAQPLVKAIGGKLLAAGYAFGEYDITVIYEAPNDQAAASLALTVAAGGATRASKTTRLLSGKEWIRALRQAQEVRSSYRPA
jgi:uncharacterized protein with GYD domain